MGWGTGRLSCFFAPRAECLICLCFSAARPPRTSRPFIWPSLGGRSGPRRSCAALRQTAIARNSDHAPRERVRDRFVAVDMPSLWWPHARRLSPSRRKPECGGGCRVCSWQIGCTSTISRCARRLRRPHSYLMIAVHTVNQQLPRQIAATPASSLGEVGQRPRSSLSSCRKRGIVADIARENSSPSRVEAILRIAASCAVSRAPLHPESAKPVVAAPIPCAHLSWGPWGSSCGASYEVRRALATAYCR